MPRWGLILVSWILPLGAAAATAEAGGTTLTVEVVATVSVPVWVGHAPGDFDRLFVLERLGQIRIIADGVVLDDPFLDLTFLVDADGGEQGLLGLAFGPDYQTNGFFYVYYTRQPDNAVVIQRYEVTADPDVADPDSAQTVLVIPQIGANHNGGWIGFGPDGYTYLAVGNGPGADSQSLDILLGKMLRIDVSCDGFPKDPERNYAIPPDNPFVGRGGAEEIWAYGLRNPWRAGFDPATGDLYIGDVGSALWEELNFQPADSPGGANYGWSCKEGNHCTGLPSSCSCADPDLVDPIFEYPNPPDAPAAIIGGVVYRGCAIPDLVGAYIFADQFVWRGGRIWKLRHDGKGNITELEEIQDELAAGPSSIALLTSFGVDAWGEIYFADRGGGEIFKIVPADGSPGDCCPADLDGDGVVGITDFLELLGDWGRCPGCPADLDGDGVVGIADFLKLLGAWGPCS